MINPVATSSFRQLDGAERLRPYLHTNQGTGHATNKAVNTHVARPLSMSHDRYNEHRGTFSIMLQAIWPGVLYNRRRTISRRNGMQSSALTA
jgi:hypothetical protein